MSDSSSDSNVAVKRTRVITLAMDQPLDFSFKPSPPMSIDKTSPPSSMDHNLSEREEEDDGMLVSVASSSPNSSLLSSTRKRGRPLPEDLKDEAYWERRRKNNEAAKRSRDARRAKEMEIALRAALLEQENLKLRFEVASLKTELAKVQCIMYHQQNQGNCKTSGEKNARIHSKD